MPEPRHSSILDKARELDTLYRRWDSLTALDADGLDARITRIEQEIADTPAQSPAEAAVQLMIATAYLEYLDSDPRIADEPPLSQARALIASALAAIVGAEGLDLDALGGAHYLPPDAKVVSPSLQ